MDTVDFALACYRVPLDYQEQLALTAPLPDHMDRLLWLANGSPDALETAVRQTGAHVQELRDAARFCVQQLCFVRGAGYHRVLGVEPGAPLERIKEHHRLLMRLFHPDRSAGRETWTDQYAARVNEAWTAVSRTPTAPDPIRDESSSWPVASAAPPPASGSDAKPWSKPAFDNPGVRFRAPAQWLPALVLGGLALAVTVVLGAMYATRSSAPSALTDDPPVAETPTDASDTQSVSPAAISAFLATPDWQAIEQREQEIRQQVVQAQQKHQKIEQNRQEQSAIEEGLMKRLRAERMQLEEQLKTEQARAERQWSEKLAAEQKRLEVLKAEQAQLERTRAERLAAEQQRLEALRAEQAKAEQLAAELRNERARLERLKAEQAHLAQESTDPLKAERTRLEEQLKVERARLEQARLERVRLDEQLKADQAKAARIRLEEQLKAERAQLEQARLERVRLEAQLKAEQAKMQQTRVAGAVSRESVPVENGLTTRELDNLISRYTRAYERGDINGILALFTEGVGSSRDRVRRDYASFFADHEVRQLSLRLNWNPRGAVASGAGRYELQAQRRNDGEARQVGGRILFKVRKQAGQALIEAIEYD
ncbi:MAG TPA: hypothetical protein DCS21_06550 [Gammaproteobacteria bacterium]|nr:hypothetical protein [Gammaproteobacteria bacterium]